MITILIAVDNDIEREGLKSILMRERDLRVVAEAGNGRDAVSLAIQHNPVIALVSVLMRDLNGADTTSKIRKLLPMCNVIAVCSHAEPMMVRRMFSSGARGYLCKECTGSFVVEAVRTVHKGEVYVGSHVEKAIIADYCSILSGESQPLIWSLSTREREVLQLIAEGHTTKRAATNLKISAKTVEAHRANIMAKLDLHSVAELTRYAIEHDITPKNSACGSTARRRPATTSTESNPYDE